MKFQAGNLRLSASDLSNHLSCQHLTSLDLSIAEGRRSHPTWSSPDTRILQQRGLQHESGYLDHLRSKGLAVTSLADIVDERESRFRTLAAMRLGTDVIAQATLGTGNWIGRADILRRVEEPSDLGRWSYEVYDCKLARETKGGSVLQLCMYSDLLSQLQGTVPEWMYIIKPGDDFEEERFRFFDFSAYYRYVKSRLEEAVTGGNPEATRPEPTSHCEVCRWWSECDAEWRRQDHLLLVAGITKLQREQLEAWDVRTVEQLADMRLPIVERPKYGSRETYTRVREQARVQIEGRREGKPVYELLPITDEHGLNLLPEPSTQDIYFDLEGDPFVGKSGREYLFGMVSDGVSGNPVYERRWAVSDADEKEAFEWFVDHVMARISVDPKMHVYHFAPYEPAALKRLMGRYATRENELDYLLRSERFVDLHKVIRRSIRASVEQYSLKALEPFHNFPRTLGLDQARAALRTMQHILELGDVPDLADGASREVEQYNSDDCFSTRSLHAWLENERRSLESGGIELKRPSPKEGEPTPILSERQMRTARVADNLRERARIASDRGTGEASALSLLANLLEWHRRENKAEWWEYYRLRDLAAHELLDERSAISGLEFISRTTARNGTATDCYTFERQETDIRAGEKVCERGEAIGEVVAIDQAGRVVTIKRTRRTAGRHPASIFVDSRGPNDDAQADALVRFGSAVADHGLQGQAAYGAAIDLLQRRPPKLREHEPLNLEEGPESVLDAAKRICSSLDGSVLAVQGPPGAGKTYTAARVICHLINQGKRVGVTACSHRVIRNLLDEVLVAAKDQGCAIRALHKVTDRSEEDLPPGLSETTSNADVLTAIEFGLVNVIGGTAWRWSREEMFEKLDVLFIDEAGQMSLADALAVSQSAKNLVLLGDPQQLEQPSKGSHPEGADASALEHLLHGAQTIPPEKGLFLGETWRLHPKICRFTSEAFYERRLLPRIGLENQRITGHSWLPEAGLCFVPVLHVGNQNACAEEVDAIADIVRSMLVPGVFWQDRHQVHHAVFPPHILVVAPYNAQVADLSERLPSIRVGTVDKFQGQEAPIVIYSLTSSSAEDAPRGMEFLFSLNRLNVATSRAKSVVIMVGSPQLLEPECKTPRQMQLANALCRYAELATAVALTAV